MAERIPINVMFGLTDVDLEEALFSDLAPEPNPDQLTLRACFPLCSECEHGQQGFVVGFPAAACAACVRVSLALDD